MPSPPDTSPVAANANWTALDRLPNGTPRRWNPCESIDVIVNPSGSIDPSFDQDVDTALAAIVAATRLPLHRVTNARGAHTVTVLWSDPTAERELSGTVLGFGGPGWNSLSPWFSVGRVVLDSTESTITGGFGTGDSWGPVLLHELGHVIGLDHTDDETEVMSPSARPDGPTTYGQGDLTGLRALGGPCPKP